MNAVEKMGLCFFLFGLLALPVSIDIRTVCIFVGTIMFVLGHFIKE